MIRDELCWSLTIVPVIGNTMNQELQSIGSGCDLYLRLAVACKDIISAYNWHIENKIDDRQGHINWVQETKTGRNLSVIGRDSDGNCEVVTCWFTLFQQTRWKRSCEWKSEQGEKRNPFQDAGRGRHHCRRSALRDGKVEELCFEGWKSRGVVLWWMER